MPHSDLRKQAGRVSIIEHRYTAEPDTNAVGTVYRVRDRVTGAWATDDRGRELPPYFCPDACERKAERMNANERQESLFL